MAQFTKGQSGNPAGKPPGSKDKRTELRGLLLPHSAKLIAKAVDMGLKGDQQMIRLCIDRLLPPLKPISEPISIETSGTDVTTLAAEVFRAATAGELALDEAAALTSMLLNRARIADVDEANRNIEMAARRIQALENNMSTVEKERLKQLLDEELKWKCETCHKKRR
jgi:hypothetical protein